MNTVARLLDRPTATFTARALRRGPRAQTWLLSPRAAGASTQPRWLAKCADAAQPKFQAEAASYRLLACTGVTPGLIGHADADGVLVLDYLPPETDFFAAIRQHNIAPRMAQLGATMARLATVPTNGHGAALDAVRHDEAAALQAAWPAALSWAQQMGASTGAGLAAASTALLDAHIAPPQLRLTQGDPAPSNVLFSAGEVRLVDFEYGGLRNALFDLARWRVRIPLQSDWFDVLCAPIRQSYGTGFDRDLDLATAYACAYMFTWLPISVATSRDQAWVGQWSLRAALVHTAACLRRLDHLPLAVQPLTDWGRAVHETLQEAWPDVGNGAPDWQRIALAPPS